MAKQEHIKVGVIGAGAWGTALARQAATNGCQVRLWAHEKELPQIINRQHENTLFLPHVALPQNLTATSHLDEALADANIILLVTPAQHLRKVAADIARLREKGLAVICAKGIEQKSGALMSEAVHEQWRDARLAVLSGPSFAHEVARGLPAALTLATDEEDDSALITSALGSQNFRLYASRDIIGAQIGGAVKNILAIACGIVEGRSLGENARAALITRGFAEMLRLGVAMGARAETLHGLCGFGDLVLTCSSPASRNMALGVALGEGKSLHTLLENRSSVAEGVFSAEAVTVLARRHHVDMPITAAVAAVVSGTSSLDDAISGLLSRPVGSEI